MKEPAAVENICRCPEPLPRTQATSKWITQRTCGRCGLLAPITLPRHALPATRGLF